MNSLRSCPCSDFIYNKLGELDFCMGTMSEQWKTVYNNVLEMYGKKNCAIGGLKGRYDFWGHW